MQKKARRRRTQHPGPAPRLVRRQRPEPGADPGRRGGLAPTRLQPASPGPPPVRAPGPRSLPRRRRTRRRGPCRRAAARAGPGPAVDGRSGRSVNSFSFRASGGIGPGVVGGRPRALARRRRAFRGGRCYEGRGDDQRPAPAQGPGIHSPSRNAEVADSGRPFGSREVFERQGPAEIVARGFISAGGFEGRCVAEGWPRARPMAKQRRRRMSLRGSAICQTEERGGHKGHGASGTPPSR